jgi:hypothetical protein
VATILNIYAPATINLYSWSGEPMALPDYFKISFGTAVIWGEAGAAGVTHTLTFEALAAAAARMGDVADLGEAWDEEYLVYLIIETGTAPTAGGTVSLYLVTTDNTDRYPANVTGSDAAYTVANIVRAGAPVATLRVTNDANTIMRQAPTIWRPAGRYVVPIVQNNMSQAVRDEATATDNDSRVILVPRRYLVQDAA